MKRRDQEDTDIQQILERLDKLSRRPENPGLAYQNLEAINALTEALRQKLTPTVKNS